MKNKQAMTQLEASGGSHCNSDNDPVLYRKSLWLTSEPKRPKKSYYIESEHGKRIDHTVDNGRWCIFCDEFSISHKWSTIKRLHKAGELSARAWCTTVKSVERYKPYSGQYVIVLFCCNAQEKQDTQDIIRSKAKIFDKMRYKYSKNDSRAESFVEEYRSQGYRMINEATPQESGWKSCIVRGGDKRNLFLSHDDKKGQGWFELESDVEKWFVLEGVDVPVMYK